MIQINNTDFFENTTQRVTKETVAEICKRLKKIIEHELINTTNDLKYQDLLSILEYLGNSDIHYSEGRDLSFDKQSFSVTELLVASKYDNINEVVSYLMYRYRFNHYPRKQISSDFPVVLCIEPTSICNLRCTMCFQSDQSFTENKATQGIMDFELFKSIIDEAKKHNLASIVLASRGEPLMNKNIYKMIEYAKSNGILDVKMNTNATLLSENNARKLIESGLDNLVFSVDSADKEEYEKIRRGAKFNKVVENIRRFNEIRNNEYPSSKLRTRVSMIVVDESQDVEYAKQYWSALVDEFAYRKVIERLNIYNKDDLVGNRPCSLLWERLYIWFDGTTSICDEDYKSILSPGKFNDSTSIYDIWTGEKMQTIRKVHQDMQKNKLHPCDKCPGF